MINRIQRILSLILFSCSGKPGHQYPVLWIGIVLNSDADAAFHFDADPDPDTNPTLNSPHVGK